MDGLVHGRRRQLRKEREARATRRRDLDQKHRDSTQLRKQRIDKLKALENDQGPLLLAPDGAAKEGTSSLNAETTDSFRHCYTCKKRFDGLHEFYSQLCPACAALNWRMRSASGDLAGRVALVTGARVKIGFEIALKLLRAGATVVATTRFPADAAARYAAAPDRGAWRDRLSFHGVDLRDVRGVEAFCAFLTETLDRLDVVVNNACQTVRRPPAYYAPLLDRERRAERALLAGDGGGGALAACARPPRWHGAASSAELSQLAVAGADDACDAALLPPGAVDVNGQQVDLRPVHSWRLPLDAVPTAEVVEVFAINAIAPFVLNARLLPLLARTAAAPPGRAFVVNVSAMEGKFYRHKTPHHPHTNMAKAALNMMTRTSAPDLADRLNVYMTCVDTGWINDENPLPRAARTAAAGFQTPIDEVDAAARVLHPVFHGLDAAEPLRGVFLKDYRESEW